MKWQMPWVVSGRSWKKCACRESNSGLDSSQKNNINQYTTRSVLVTHKLCYIGSTGWFTSKKWQVMFCSWFVPPWETPSAPHLWSCCLPLFVCSFPLPYHHLLSYYRPGPTLCTPLPQHVYLYIYHNFHITLKANYASAGQSGNLTNDQRQQQTPFTLESPHGESSSSHPFIKPTPLPASKVNELGAPLKSAAFSLVHTTLPLHPSHHDRRTYFAGPTSHTLLHHCFWTSLSPMYFVTAIRWVLFFFLLPNFCLISHEGQPALKFTTTLSFPWYAPVLNPSACTVTIPRLLLLTDTFSTSATTIEPYRPQQSKQPFSWFQIVSHSIISASASICTFSRLTTVPVSHIATVYTRGHGLYSDACTEPPTSISARSNHHSYSSQANCAVPSSPTHIDADTLNLLQVM